MAAIRKTSAQAKLQNKMRPKSRNCRQSKDKAANFLNIGEELVTSGVNPYKDVKDPQGAANVLLSVLRFRLEGLFTLNYQNDNSLLIEIDGQFYEITGSDLAASVLKMAKNAHVLTMFIGGKLGELLISGIVDLWKSMDKTYNEVNRLLE
ncbi:MAG: hypothetical protein HC906_16195 [Bacteroidales bacterium]|nr:hypothetical protein [Bacteroidales bacterium]